jgi:hypothetical protein
VKALLIPVDGPPREVDLPGGGTRFMRSLKALIGTECAERIQVTSRWEAWLDGCYRPRYLNIQRLNYLWTIRHSSARIAGNLVT